MISPIISWVSTKRSLRRLLLLAALAVLTSALISLTLATLVAGIGVSVTSGLGARGKAGGGHIVPTFRLIKVSVWR